MTENQLGNSCLEYPDQAVVALTAGLFGRYNACSDQERRGEKKDD
jgi:hypothetical protein